MLLDYADFGAVPPGFCFFARLQAPQSGTERLVFCIKAPRENYLPGGLPADMESRSAIVAMKDHDHLPGETDTVLCWLIALYLADEITISGLDPFDKSSDNPFYYALADLCKMIELTIVILFSDHHIEATIPNPFLADARIIKGIVDMFPDEKGKPQSPAQFERCMKRYHDTHPTPESVLADFADPDAAIHAATGDISIYNKQPKRAKIDQAPPPPIERNRTPYERKFGDEKFFSRN